MGVTFMFGAGMKLVSWDFHHVVWEKHCLNRVVRKQVNYIITTVVHLTVLSWWAHKIFFKHFLVKLCLYKLYFSLNPNCKCVISCTAQEHHQLKSHKREENRRRRYSYLSRHSQPCWMFLHHVKSWLSAVAPATQPQLQVRNIQYLQSLMLNDIFQILNFLISATGDLYTWGWGEFILVFNLTFSCCKLLNTALFYYLKFNYMAIKIFLLK